MGTGYTLFRRGLPNDAGRVHGVGFADWTALLLSAQESIIAKDERIMTLQLSLAKDRFDTDASVYVSTLDSCDVVKDCFQNT